MKALSRILSSLFIAAISVAQGQENELAKSERFIRGKESPISYQSFVIPLDSQKGVALDPMGNNAGKFHGKKPWFSNIERLPRKHLLVSGNNASHGILFENPIVAFGSTAGGSPLYVGQDYSFGIYGGSRHEFTTNSTPPVTDIYITVHGAQNDAPIVSQMFIKIPRRGTEEWNRFVTGGYQTTIRDGASGLNVTLRLVESDSSAPSDRWGTGYTSPIILTLRAANSHYYYKIETRGFFNIGNQWYPITEKTDNAHPEALNSLFTVNFDEPPPWRSVFIHQPHFDGEFIPSAYRGKSLEELLDVRTRVNKDLGPVAESYLTIDNSPELRSHPILDKLVEDTGRDPIALSNYVHNEIELTDAISYNDQGQVSETSINAGGLNRGALATYLEGQGNPAEQCALLIYLLRKAGIPAAYVFPPKNELFMLDARMSRLLRMQIRGLTSPEGTSRLPRLLPVNYPWVAAKMTENGQQKWVHLFPWIKDTEIKEGLNLFEKMPADAKSGMLWVKRYLNRDPEIMSLLDSGENTVAHLFPKYVSKQLEKNHPGISLDDIGVKIRDRKTNYTRWEDFPQPWSVTEKNGQMTVKENLNFNPSNFDILSLTIFSDRNKNGLWDTGEPQIQTGELRTLDLHNRRFVLHFKQTSGDNHSMFLTLSPFRPDSTGVGDYTADLLKEQKKSIALSAEDQNLVATIELKRHRTLPSPFPLPAHWVTPMGFNNLLHLRKNIPIKKGDTNALCLMMGRVTDKMVRLHAEEYWAHQEQLQDNVNAQNETLEHAPAYIMGMSYYKKVSRFRKQLEDLTKTRTISNIAYGFSKLGARRNPNGTLINNGEIDLVYPQVDMFFHLAAYAGNGTLRPDQNIPRLKHVTDFGALTMADGSAQEHAIINEFFQQKNAASTVTLLHKSVEAHGGIITLTKSDYETKGNEAHTINGVTKSLKDWCGPTFWERITNEFAETQLWKDYHLVYVTKGPQTLANGDYTGMGAFNISPAGVGALISSEHNGGYGNSAGNYTFRPQNYKNLIIKYNSNNTPYITTAPPSLHNPILAHSIYAQNIAKFNQQFNSGAVKISNADTKHLQKIQSRLNYQPDSSWGNQPTPIPVSPPAPPAPQAPVVQVVPAPHPQPPPVIQTPSQPAATPIPQPAPPAPRVPPPIPQIITAAQNFGSLLTPAWYGDKLQKFVADPVNVVTGEFYIDTPDLNLAGPMPLEIRRNYSSQNLGFGEFGRGWKISLVPYITIASSGNILYAAEMDGSIIAYVKDHTNPNKWMPTAADNPSLTNINGNQPIHNPFNAYILKTQTGTDTIYTLHSPNGDKRTYKLKQYPLAGITRERPYLEKWEDHKGNFHTFTIGSNPAERNDYGQLTRIKSSNGNFLAFTYNLQGQTIETFTGDGLRLHYHYDEHGDLTRVTHADGSETHYTYKHEKQTLGGKEQTYSTHLLASERKSGDRLLENDYDSEGRVTVQRATVGENLIPVQNASFKYTNHQETDGTITGHTIVEDTFKNKTHYEYTKGLITKIKDPEPLNHTIQQEWYLPSDTTVGAYPRSLKQRIDKRGLITQYKYDTRGNLIERTTIGDITGDGQSDTATTKFAYNINNLLTSVQSPLNTETTIAYENTAYPWLPTRIERKIQGTLTFSALNTYYETSANNKIAKGLLQKQQIAAGTPEERVIEYTHDERGYLKSKKQKFSPDGRDSVTTDLLTKYEHNPRGELIEKTAPSGAFTRFAYDPLGNQTWIEQHDENGALINWQYTYYNHNGEIEWIDGPRYNPEDYIWRKYDRAGRIKEELHWRSQANKEGSGVEPPRGDNWHATTFYKHDHFGNLVEIKDPRRNSTVMTYDAIGQMLSRSQHKGYAPGGKILATEKFTYEPGGKIASHTDPLGAETKHFYTADGKLRRQQNPDGTIQEWRYLLDGRLEKEILPDGNYREKIYQDTTRTVIENIKNFSGETLLTEKTTFNIQGDPISFTDSENNTFNWTYDKLSRITSETGQATSGHAAQQTKTITYDDKNRTIQIINHLGEKTVITKDPLGRTTNLSIKDTVGQIIRSTHYTYSPDKNSITQTEGSGTYAVTTTTYFDHLGNPLLKTFADKTKEQFEYDHNGNLTAFSDGVGNKTLHTYDALERLESTTLPGGARTNFLHDVAGNLLQWNLPGSEDLQWHATYDKAGRKLTEYLRGKGGDARERTYTYYSEGSNIGRLKSVTDARQLTHTFTYHPLGPVKQIATTGSITGSQEFAWDRRGHLTSLLQTGAGDPIKISRSYSPYGNITEETITIAGAIHQNVTQKWDGAGRRSGFNLGDLEQNFIHRADNLLSNILLPRQNRAITYSYGTNGILTQRRKANLSQTLIHDSLGRLENVATESGGATLLNEKLTWLANSFPKTYQLQVGGGVVQERQYSYNSRGQLLTEKTAAGHLLSYEFDENTQDGGLGIRTKVSHPSYGENHPAFEHKVTQKDNWGRAHLATTTRGTWKSNIAGTTRHSEQIQIAINGLKYDPVRPSGENGTWSVPIALTPGIYSVTASAINPDNAISLCPPHPACNFSVTPQPREIIRNFDKEGYLTKKETVDPTDRNKKTTKEHTWDAWGRLAAVTERDEQNNGYNWTAIYDGFGRRLKTVHTPLIAGNAQTAKTQTILSYYDPNVEFLEVGIKLNNQAPTWKLYGVDKDGTHGGLQGIGGLEEILTPAKNYGMIHNALGHIVAMHDGTNIQGTPTAVGGYGPIPGALSLPLSPYRDLAQVSHWLGKRLDETGYTRIGERDYDSDFGEFISPDPLGHAGSFDLLSYALGNPVVYTDPTGRIATPFLQNAGAQASNLSHSIADTVLDAVPGGISLLSSAMGYGMNLMGMQAGHLHAQAAWLNERLSPNARAGLYDPNSLVATTVAAGSVIIAPGSAPTKIASKGAIATSGVKPLFGKPGSAVADVVSSGVSTASDKAAFWSGRAGANRSAAEMSGLTTLEKTSAGQALDAQDLFSKFPYDQAIVPWENLSRQFASEASGVVRAWTGGASPTSIWSKIEKPTLMLNPNVNKIIIQDATQPWKTKIIYK